MKRYIYKIYDSSSNYLTTWSDVISEFQMSWEVNSAGSQVKVALGRSPESIVGSDDIVLDNRVKVMLIDDDNDSLGGKVIFNGKIADFNTVYSANNDVVEVILLGLGADLDSHVIDMGDSIIQDDRDYEMPFGATGMSHWALAQSFTITEMTRARSITIRTKKTTSNLARLQLVVASGLPTFHPSTPLSSAASVQHRIENLIYEEVEFTFSTPLDLAAGTYHFTLENIDATGVSNLYIEGMNYRDVYSGGQLYTALNQAVDPTQAYSVVGGGGINKMYDIWFKVNAGTVQSFSSEDHGNIIKKIMDYYSSDGGNISYDSSTVDLTGLEATYTFNTNTVLEGIKKAVEMAPPHWYWYIDQRTNMLHFHRKSNDIDHRLELGKSISKITVESRSEDIVNTIYFTGGNGLFKKFVSQGSVDSYGRRSIRYTDQRVTRNDTAELIASTILEAKYGPEIRVLAEVIDNADGVHGIDIDILNPGDTVKFGNFGTDASSLWDNAIWDVDYWDYNDQKLDSLILSIVKIDYLPDHVVLQLSTAQPDINKRIEDINRRLVAAETVNNADVEI